MIRSFRELNLLALSLFQFGEPCAERSPCHIGTPSGIKGLRPALAIVLVVMFGMPVTIIAFGELIEGVPLLVYMLVISAILSGLAYWTLRPRA